MPACIAFQLPGIAVLVWFQPEYNRQKLWIPAKKLPE
jgi:hypothetical protein